MDNAPNFTKIFWDDDSEDFIPIEIPRLSCCCHSMQLLLSDLYDEDVFSRMMTEILKIIPLKLSFYKKKRYWKAWFQFLFSCLTTITEFNLFIIIIYTKEYWWYISNFWWRNIGNARRRTTTYIYEFTVNFEGYCITQAQAFVEFRALEVNLEVINTDRSKRILGLAQIRFDTTADLNISKLCYNLINALFHEKIERFPHVLEEDATKSLENAALLIKETEFIDSFKPTIIEICRILKIQQDLVLVPFEYMMKFLT